MPSPVAVARISLVTRWAPAPSSEPTADSRTTVGNSSASARTRAGRSGKTRARHTKIGTASAARPDVDGTAKVVTTRAAVSRWNSCRGVRAAVTTNAVARVARPELVTPAAMTNAASSNHTVSSPRVANSPSVLSTPVSTRTTAAPRAT
jgi:hypothetical protein